MGLFDFFAGSWKSQKERAARAREDAGDLLAASELFIDAKLFDDAARVLLLRADGEGELDKRLALCASAARVAADPELRRRALSRKALLALDVLRKERVVLAREELRRVAGELEEVGELERAADAYRLAGDEDAEIRALTAAGSIDRLEARLAASARVDRQARDREELMRRLRDLDRTAERRAALELAAEWLSTQDDDEVRTLARAIRQRLLRGPLIDLELDGSVARWVLGAEVTLGRGEASVHVPSAAVSRRHLRLFVGADGPAVEDLGTRNGTELAGARMTGPVPIGRGLELLLGGEVPCALTPEAGGPSVRIDVAAQRIIAPLGELRLGDWRLRPVTFDGVSLVELCTPPGAPRPVMDGLELAERVELSIGDALCRVRGERPWLRVVAQRGS